MKKSLLAFAAIAAAVFVAVTGCETEKLSDKQLSISPAKATIAPGESLALTAQGGWDYTWSFVGEQYGTLSSYNGKQVTYTAPTTDAYSTLEVNKAVIIQVSSASNLTASAEITVHADAKNTDENQSSSSASSSASSSTSPSSSSSTNKTAKASLNQ